MTYDEKARLSGLLRDDKGKHLVRDIIDVLVGSKHVEEVTSNSKQKAYLRSIMSIAASVKNPGPSPWQLKLSKHDKRVNDVEGDDPLVIFATISSFQVKKILMDIGSSIDILMAKAIHKMGFSRTYS
ncbi:hypothetical protein J1N35_002503 [Gossypium stocksii]|uniref:Uncharacterized protein n=1 Tax=Gossypium stocksii TaxID=47602 RepID=A0A9D3WL53_9ROSI|nr:hypothetical protein J1N35_002503 [Gossypium stocksii]